MVKTITLPMKCSTVKKWNQKLPEIILAESIIYSVMSVIFVISGTITKYQLDSFVLFLVGCASIGMLWGIFVIAFSLIMYRKKIAFAIAKYEYKIEYAYLILKNNLKNVIPHLECIKDGET